MATSFDSSNTPLLTDNLSEPKAYESIRHRPEINRAFTSEVGEETATCRNPGIYTVVRNNGQSNTDEIDAVTETHDSQVTKQDKGCTNQEQLKKFIDSPVDNTSKKDLEQNCISLGLKFSSSTPICIKGFVEAVSAQLRFLSSEKSTDDSVSTEFESWRTEMMKNGKLADHEAVFETARMLKRDIVIVTSHPNSDPEKIVTWIVGEPSFSGDPLLLGLCKHQYWSLEPIQKSKIRKNTTEERVCEMKSNAKRATACTNLDDLERFLSDQSVLNESEMGLRKNCRAVGLKFGTKTKSNENSFFEAVSAQLRRRKLQEGLSKTKLNSLKAKTPEELRNEVHAHPYLDSNNQMHSGRAQIEDSSQEGDFADHSVVFATAKMLETDIVVVTSSSNSSPHENVTWIVGKSDFKGEPLLIGHYWPNNYQSLEPIIKNVYRPKPTREWVTEMRKYALKDFTCTCHEEILLKKYQPGDLIKGDHIMRPVDSCCCRLIWFHHAIFESESESEPKKSQREQTNESVNIKFNSIGFTKTGKLSGNKSTVCQNPEKLDLQKDELYKIEYYYPKNTHETVFTEMKTMQLNNTKYHLGFNNCEHVCRSCVTGESKSLQADLCNYHFQTICYGLFPRLVRLIIVILAVVPDFVRLNNVKDKVHAYLAVVDSFATFFYLVMIVTDMCKSHFRYKSKMMCPKCYCEQKLKFIARIVFFILIFIGLIYYWLEEIKVLDVNKLELGFTLASVLYWLVLELYLMCSEKCRRNAARCLLFYVSCCSCCACCPCWKSDKCRACRDRCNLSLPSCCDSLCKCEVLQNCENRCLEC